MTKKKNPIKSIRFDGSFSKLSKSETMLQCRYKSIPLVVRDTKGAKCIAWHVRFEQSSQSMATITDRTLNCRVERCVYCLVWMREKQGREIVREGYTLQRMVGR